MLRTQIVSCFVYCLVATAVVPLRGVDPVIDTRRGDAMIASYFQAETAMLQEACLSDIRSLDNWKEKKSEYRRQLFDMLGLEPLPERTAMQAQVTGKVEHDDFTVENVQFQSRPGLYVTGNLYLPKKATQAAPAILYVCGHGAVKKDGVSYGNKVHYQHHGAWLARHGYVCFAIDSLQLGEIEGIHHGTYKYNMWWWLSRGYTPAGVEAWNCIRALDYLQSRPEVDPERLGVTGRSGGGAYSWWIAALDERIKAAVPTAGITDLKNHVVDGCVEGHCDCMFMNNTYQWDYPLLAALVAPRPLLIANTDRDGIFPLDGVYRTYQKVRHIYELNGVPDKVALNITAGGHVDTQELQMHCIRWFDQHLKQEKRLVEQAAVPYFTPKQLQVFSELPADQQNTQIQETFVPAATTPALPSDAEQWQTTRDAWKAALTNKTFAAWPKDVEGVELHPVFNVEKEGVRLVAFDFLSQQSIRLRLFLASRPGQKPPEATVLNVVDQKGWTALLGTLRSAFVDELKDETAVAADSKAFQALKKLLVDNNWTVAYIAPRGVGPTAWDQSEKKQIQHRRRFYLLGQTLEGMQVWDVRRAIQAIREVDGLEKTPLRLNGQGDMGGIALYASLFEPSIQRLDLTALPISHRDGPQLLNVLRTLDMPQAAAMAAERSQVVLSETEANRWEYTRGIVERLGWDRQQLQIREKNPTP